MPPTPNEVYLAAIEGGGTTFVVSVARVIASKDDEPDDDDDDILRIGPNRLQILHTVTIPPKTPDDNAGGGGGGERYPPARILDETCSFLSSHLPPRGSYSGVGIATFGPAGVDPGRPGDYGTILSGCPKREWRGVDLLTPIRRACGLDEDDEGRLRVGFDTDVNAPAIAEFRHRRYLQRRDEDEDREASSASSYSPSSQQSQSTVADVKPLTSLSYITVGTGVGVGLVLNSRPIHGLLHPEGGHVAIQPLPHDTFGGYSWGRERSPYGGVGTVEGVASSVALTERLLQTEGVHDGDGANDNADIPQTREVLSALPDSHPIWAHAANAIANLCVSLLLLTSCQRIVLGGGVMKRRVLYGMVRERTCTLLNGYLAGVDELSEEGRLVGIIVGGSWEGIGSGLVGAFALALDSHERSIGKGKGDGTAANCGEENDPKESSILVSESTYQDQSEEKKNEDEQRSFTSGMLAGIGLSFGCVLLASFFGGRGMRHRR
mmetsp:Transcript_8933/g.21682  ORF Transcript_8933/g.21682 Transcript_8933/m.21682 type:complete len:492 (-) Transcript_8933:86-1561(-)